MSLTSSHPTQNAQEVDPLIHSVLQKVEGKDFLKKQKYAFVSNILKSTTCFDFSKSYTHLEEGQQKLLHKKIGKSLCKKVFEKTHLHLYGKTLILPIRPDTLKDIQKTKPYDVIGTFRAFYRENSKSIGKGAFSFNHRPLVFPRVSGNTLDKQKGVMTWLISTLNAELPFKTSEYSLEEQVNLLFEKNANTENCLEKIPCFNLLQYLSYNTYLKINNKLKERCPQLFERLNQNKFITLDSTKNARFSFIFNPRENSYTATQIRPHVYATGSTNQMQVFGRLEIVISVHEVNQEYFVSLGCQNLTFASVVAKTEQLEVISQLDTCFTPKEQS